MSKVSSLENLKSVLNSKFEDILLSEIVSSNPCPYLIIRQLKQKFFPKFHLIASPSNFETKFIIKLLTFHGKVVVSVSLITHQSNTARPLCQVHKVVPDFENDTFTNKKMGNFKTF